MTNSSEVKWWAYIACGAGLLAILLDHLDKLSGPATTSNPAYPLAVFTMLFLGVLGIAVSKCLKNIEERLDRLEGKSETKE